MFLLATVKHRELEYFEIRLRGPIYIYIYIYIANHYVWQDKGPENNWPKKIVVVL